MNSVTAVKPTKVCKRKADGFMRKAAAFIATLCTMVPMMSMTAFADDFMQVNVDGTKDVNAGEMMGKIIGILLTITRYVGVALVVYGVYEIVMSFMQNQPEAKTKGIVMALAGVVMIALKSILCSLGVVS